MPDRIVAGTWAFAAAMTRGDVTVRDARAEHLEIALDKLARAGADVERLDDGFRVRRWTDRPRAVDVVTLPYPGFPTDLQPHGARAERDRRAARRWSPRTSSRRRFVFVNELVRLGADVRTDGHHAVVRGSRAAVRRAGAGQRHPGRRRARRSPACVADGVTTVQRRRTTSTAATRASSTTCAGSAPTCSGCAATGRHQHGAALPGRQQPPGPGLVLGEHHHAGPVERLGEVGADPGRLEPPAQHLALDVGAGRGDRDKEAVLLRVPAAPRPVTTELPGA